MSTNKNEKLIVDAFVTPHDAVFVLAGIGDPKYVFGRNAIHVILGEYRSGCREFSFMSADNFVRNLYNNLRSLLNIVNNSETKKKIGCCEENLKLINGYLKELEIPYHFEMIGYGFGENDYLHCFVGYEGEE